MAFELSNISEISGSVNQGVVSTTIAGIDSVTSSEQGSQNLFCYFSAIDNLSTISAANYFLPIAQNQLSVFDWILVTGTDGSTILEVTAITFTANVLPPTGISTAVIIAGGASGEAVLNNITAHNPGGQSTATQLINGINNVTVVGASGDSVKLPLVNAGMSVVVMNNGANPMQVYGSGTDTINNVATATGVSQLAGSIAVYYGITDAPAGNWESNLGASSILAGSVDFPQLAAEVLQQTIVFTVTAAQINATYTTPMALLPLPPTGFVYIIVSASYKFVYGSAPFAAGGALSLQYDSTTQAGGVQATTGLAASDVNAMAADMVFTDLALPVVGLASKTVNKGIYLATATQAFTGGTGTVTNIRIRYYTVAG